MVLAGSLANIGWAQGCSLIDVEQFVSAGTADEGYWAYRADLSRPPLSFDGKLNLNCVMNDLSFSSSGKIIQMDLGSDNARKCQAEAQIGELNWSLDTLKQPGRDYLVITAGDMERVFLPCFLEEDSKHFLTLSASRRAGVSGTAEIVFEFVPDDAGN